MVYEGARSITGPLLAQLGASALVVGVVTGVGEAAALVLRLFFGRAADRSNRYWPMTIAGYALTAVSVPLLAITPFIGAAGLAMACALILAERTGKAVRSPAKSTLLAHVATRVGLGRAFGVHKALDQTGSFTGPLLVAGLVALTGAIWPAMAALALPGAAAMAILVWMRRRIGEPANDTLARRTDQPRPDDTPAPYPDQPLTDQPHDDEPRPERSPAPHLPAAQARRTVLPRTFWLFAASSGAATAGLVTFGVISFHLAHEHVVSLAAIPVVYAAGMAMAAVAALATGFGYDRIRGKVLYVLPILAAAVPWLAFADRAGLALLGVLVWGAANGIQDSTVKALVADLVPPGRRATAYGIFAAIQGAGAVAGGTLAGALYARSIPLLGAIIAAIEAVALALYIATLHQPADDLV
jgi:MFS family permease